ncbi:MAG: leucine-rich repeat domain-containing protein [Muribaculaceae bacterium]|nr:leucine-rich repeat domain-containing protein [Muribaculaceae bacterium]
MKIQKFINGLLTCVMLLSINFSGWAHIELNISEDGIDYYIYHYCDSQLWLAVSGSYDDENKGGTAIIPEKLIVPHLMYEDIMVPAIVTKITERAFMFSKLKRLQMPNTITRIGMGAFWQSELENIKLSENLVSIDDQAFSEMKNLKSIRLPESLIVLEYDCFSQSGLREIYLPASLRSMGGNTFGSCYALNDIYSSAEIPPRAEDFDFGIYPETDYSNPKSFRGPNPLECVLHVPAGCEDLYRNAPGWRVFRNIVALDDEDVNDPAEIIEIENDNDQTTANISYQVANGSLTVQCNTGDKVAVYDVNGICLDSKTFSTAGEYLYHGKGTRILTLNDASIKIQL